MRFSDNTRRKDRRSAVIFGVVARVCLLHSPIRSQYFWSYEFYNLQVTIVRISLLKCVDFSTLFFATENFSKRAYRSRLANRPNCSSGWTRPRRRPLRSPVRGPTACRECSATARGAPEQCLDSAGGPAVRRARGTWGTLSADRSILTWLGGRQPRSRGRFLQGDIRSLHAQPDWPLRMSPTRTFRTHNFWWLGPRSSLVNQSVEKLDDYSRVSSYQFFFFLLTIRGVNKTNIYIVSAIVWNA